MSLTARKYKSRKCKSKQNLSEDYVGMVLKDSLKPIS